jgi:hypothetical protein
MGLSSIHTAWIAIETDSLHFHAGPLRGFQHWLEDATVYLLYKPDPNIYLHWGMYESGKSRAASNAVKRLQKAGKLVMLLHGWDFTYLANVKSWLRVGIGLLANPAEDRFSKFFPADKLAVLLIDHTDYLIKKMRHVLKTVCLKCWHTMPVLLSIADVEMDLILRLNTITGFVGLQLD